MIETVLKCVLLMHLLFGFIAWLIGMKSFGGSKKYKTYIREELNNSIFFYYAVFIAFVLLWPLFIRRGEK